MNNQKNLFNEITLSNIDEAINCIDNNYSLSTDHQLTNNSLHYDACTTIHSLVELTGDTESFEVESYAKFPLFFEASDFIFIPNKVERVLDRYVSKADLKEINPDIEVAKELCLIYLSNLSNAFYESTSGWKRLQASILHSQLSTDTSKRVYTKIFELLKKGSSAGPIVERSNNYTKGQESYRYRLGEAYRNKGIKKYKLSTNYAKNLRRKTYFSTLNMAMDNVIGKNLINLYSSIDLPSVEEIKIEAKRLIKLNYLTKKGKILTQRNKHKNEYWNDFENRSFVEDSIELFLRLTENGFLIPMVGDAKSGGRVIDSFVLMPSWIRNLCKINGKQIVEADYSALHPNIAMNIYEGNSEYLTHNKVAEMANIDVKKVKVEHLSFFNKRWESIEKSPLYSFYMENESNLMYKLKFDKEMFGHKITSKRMFKLEVDIMTSVISKLNSEGIYVGYVYDALFCSPQYKEKVTNLMNQEIIKFGVKTIAK